MESCSQCVGLQHEIVLRFHRSNEASLEHSAHSTKTFTILIFNSCDHYFVELTFMFGSSTKLPPFNCWIVSSGTLVTVWHTSCTIFKVCWNSFNSTFKKKNKRYAIIEQIILQQKFLSLTLSTLFISNPNKINETTRTNFLFWFIWVNRIFISNETNEVNKILWWMIEKCLRINFYKVPNYTKQEKNSFRKKCKLLYAKVIWRRWNDILNLDAIHSWFLWNFICASWICFLI